MKNPLRPFHVVKRSHNDRHTGYEIYINNLPFLVQAVRDEKEKERSLKRHEAYAIAKLLNDSRPDLKWTDKFSDPY